MRHPHPSLRGEYLPIDIETTASFILDVQTEAGEIPWSVGGITDPWDHVEGAMGLTVAGHFEAARRAYVWSARTQLEDGSWWSTYLDGEAAEGAYKDSNMTAYIAVGLFHYLLATGDFAFVELMWPTCARAIDYVVGMQAPGGEIIWAKRRDGSIDPRALLAGSSSIHLSLCCALRLAHLLGEDPKGWEVARIKLRDAIRHRPYLFDQSKSCFSMDWYYPVLGFALTGYEAKRRIASRWDTFVAPSWGVRCVADKPWATMAETAELTIALAAIGEFELAAEVFSWLADKRYEDGAYWTGVTFPDGTIYTVEKTTWTAAAVLLAADILYNLSAASGLFSHALWRSFPCASKHRGT